jgi:hypothetical protein
MTDITIPPEAVAAAKREAAATVYRLVEPDTRAHELTENEVAEIAIAALRAGIAAWPGMWHIEAVDFEGKVILPLPQETRDE